MPGPSTILATKDLAPLAYVPLLLAQLQFPDGTFLYLSSAPLNTAEGGFAYGGNNYLARIAQQDVQALQARSAQGIDRIPAVTLHILDSDRTIWTNFEQAVNKGFFGTTLSLVLVFWQAGTANFSSNSWPMFVGVCDTPSMERSSRGDVLVVSANASRNNQRVFLPVWHVEQRCGNTFPSTAAQRLEGAADMSSQYWGCGYDPDQAGTDPEIGGDCRRGNGLFTTCDYTKTSCVARGMYIKDSSNRQTGRFTGIQFAPTNRETQSKSYLEGKTLIILSGRNDSIYQESVPMLYGTQWVRSPIVANVLGDANTTRFEVVICQDDIGADGINQLVVNGVIVPHVSSSPDPKAFAWFFVSTGNRNGAPNLLPLYDGKGDPYGSMACIVVVVYRQIADSGSAPNVQVLAVGPRIKTPTTAVSSGQASWPKVRTTNAAFCTLDALIWSNYRYSDVDLQSIINEAPYCDVPITYTDLNGNTSTHPRYKAQFALLKRRSAAEVINALLQSFNAQLSRSPQTGLLQLRIRKTLADQQSAPVSGSNYVTAVSSVAATGGGASGYWAWRFDETNICRDDPDQPPILPVSSDSSAQVPTTVTVAFQDEDNSYSDDSATIRDADAINRAGGFNGSIEVQQQLDVLGISNFDQAVRVMNTFLAERLRGNEIGDPRGTRYFKINSNVRIAHLRIGDICGLNWQPLNISNQSVRVTAIQPSMNFEKAVVTVAWHNDQWYTDAFGQQGPPLLSDPRSGRPNRRPYPWQPFGIRAIANDSVYGSVPGFVDQSWYLFDVSQAYSVLADGTAHAALTVYGCPPANVLSTSGTGGTLPPLIGIQGSTAASGGSIPGSITIYMAISARDSSGKFTPLSPVAAVVIPAGTNTNTATTPPISWQGGTVGYILYAGSDSNNLSEQARNDAATPSTVTITALNYETYGPPDQLADTINFRAKVVLHGGVFGDVLTSVSVNTLSFTPPSPFTVNQFVGHDLELVARSRGDASQVSVQNYRVTANDAAGNFTVTPDPVGGGSVIVGDVFIMLFLPTTITPTTISDANLINPYASAGLTAGAETGVLRIFKGTGQGQIRTIVDNTTTGWTISQPWDTTPDSTSRFLIEEASWQYNVDSERIMATDPGPAGGADQVANIIVDNYAGKTMLLQANIFDADGNGSLEPFAPLRMIYVWGGTGAPGGRPDGYFTDAIVSNNVQIDLANGLNHLVVLNQTAQITFLPPIFTGGTIVPGSTFSLYVDQDATGSRPTPAFSSAATGFYSDVGNNSVDGTASTRSAYQFTYHSNNLWGVDIFTTSGATS